MKKLCKVTFIDGTEREWIETRLTWAIFNIECIFGKAKVRLDASYYIPEKKAQCLIDISTMVGRYVAEIFIGMMNRELGEEGFSLERIEK